MKSDKFLRAMGELDEALIAEYEQAKKLKKRRLILRYTALAASLCLILTATIVALPRLNQQDPVGSTEPSEGTTVTESTNPEKPEPTGPFSITSVSASGTNGAYVSTDTNFIVAAENATVDLVREHLFISGGPEYTVSEGETEGTFTVSLDKNLSAGTVVSLSSVTDGVIDYSWAFQTESALQIEGTYPRDTAFGVDEFSVIEIELSRATTESIGAFVTFQPELSGMWEQIGNIQRFTPAAPLKDNTQYQVTVAPGFSFDGVTLESGYSFSFSTADSSVYDCVPDPITLDGINSYRTGEQITIRYKDRTVDVNAPINRVCIEQFRSVSDLVSFAQGDRTVTTITISDADFSVEHRNDQFYDIILNNPLPEGYYLARVYSENNTHLFDWIIQMNPLSVYACVTERDILVWVADAAGLLSDIPVQYGETTVTTDKTGIALLEDVTDGSEELGYLYIGDPNQPMAVAIENYTHDYPSGYLYTDRPQYKSTDTVQVWGTIPLSLFYEVPEDGFTLTLGNQQEIPVIPDEDGCFTASFALKDQISAEFTISLRYRDTQLATRSFKVTDYELQNYRFKLLADQNYVVSGENYHFDVLVSHISGVKVVGKDVRIVFGGVTYYATTGENGIASFSVPTEQYTGDFGSKTSDNRSEIETCSLRIYNGDIAEEAATDPAQSTTVYLLHSTAQASVSHEEPSLTVTCRMIDPTGIQMVSGTGADSNILAAYKDVPVNVTAVLHQYERKIISYEYNPYSKKNVPVYSDETDTVLSEKVYTVQTENGIARIDLSADFDLPENTDLKRFAVTYEIDVPVEEGRIHRFSRSYSASHYESTAYSQNKHFIGTYSHVGIYVSYSYDLYRYSFSSNGKIPNTFGRTITYKEGDTVDLELVSLDGTFSPAGGTVLRILYGQEIREHSLFADDEDLSFSCDETVLPHGKVAGAYYLNGVFYRLPYTYLQIDTQTRETQIALQTDKESYAPGEEVTLTVKTEKADGSPLSCTVNISVANEAVFGGEPEYNRILSNLLFSQDYTIYPSYAFSSYRDFSLCYEPGGWGGGGGDEVRSDFGDTATFQTVKTDENGEATVTFTLPDDVTEYRITAHAASEALYYGVTTDSITTNLDFFLQFTEPRAVKDTDDLVLNATTVASSYGTVDFSFTVKETGAQLHTYAFVGENASVNFGKLPVGQYTARIDASYEGASDAVEFPFEILSGAASVTVREQIDLSKALTLNPVCWPLEVEIFTASTERYFSYFDFLQNNMSDRLDTLLPGLSGARLKNKLLGKNVPVPFSKINYEYYQGGALHMLPTSETDYVLTALDAYYTPEIISLGYHSSGDSLGQLLTADQAIERLTVQAALGNAVLADLHSAQVAAQGDAYLQTLLSLSYAMLGDYDNATAMYRAATGESDEAGYPALRALAATFVDKEHAASMLDTLIAEDPSAPYLSYAVFSYLSHSADLIKEEQTLTLRYGEEVKTVRVSGLTVETVTIAGQGPITIEFETASADVRAAVTYESGDAPTGGAAITAYLEGSMQKYADAILVLNLESVPYGYGQIDILLPACMRYSGTNYPQSGVGVNAEYERVTVYRSSSSGPVIRLPMLLINDGEYVFEPIFLTANGEQFRSEAFTVSVEETKH